MGSDPYGISNHIVKPVCAVALTVGILCAAATGFGAEGKAGAVTILLDEPGPVFSPEHALGAGVDGHEEGEVRRMLSPENVTRMLSVGLKPLTYRLRTELAVEAWHWNPRGSWSDAARRQGYWISDSSADAPIELSYGYRLPRRGNTGDEANDDGYSRIDDGDPETFWKSNPYLDAHFTGEDNARHPQWVVIDFDSPQKINALRIQWGNPFATDFTVEYATDRRAVYSCQSPPGVWREFPRGTVRGGAGRDMPLRLADAAISARWVRIRMTASACASGEGTADIRDRLGYAIREIRAGVMDARGDFHDAVVHAPDHRQTMMRVSSTDPWHREIDRDPMVEQPGFDFVFKSGLTNGLPMLAPAAIVYDTPENAAAEVAFLKARGYPVSKIELGEEPDGQNIDPADYGALYMQFADAMHKVDGGLQVGGPSFVTLNGEAKAFDSIYGNGWWLARFLDFLKAHGHAADFSFLSFEWYPFDHMRGPTAPQLARAPSLLRNALALLPRSGWPRTAPTIISEYGYSAFAGRPEVDIAGALLNADIAAQFLTLGGDTAYLYGYEPNELIRENGGSWGNNMLFQQDKDGGIRSPMATYYGARMLAQEWAQPDGGIHRIFPARTDLTNPRGEALVTAYAARRPDRRWALLLINKDPGAAHRMRVRFSCADERTAKNLPGPFDVCQFSAQQYEWHENGENGFAARSEPPAKSTIADLREGVLLPPYSLTVLRSAPEAEEVARTGE